MLSLAPPILSLLLSLSAPVHAGEATHAPPPAAEEAPREVPGWRRVGAARTPEAGPERAGHVDLGLVAGAVLTRPGAGVQLQATGRKGVLRATASGALWGRGDKPPHGPSYPAGVTGLELGLDFFVGRQGRARLGPFAGLDTAWTVGMEVGCGGKGGCRFQDTAVIGGLGGLGLAFQPAWGVAWSTNAAAPDRPGLDLSFGMQHALVYDVVWPVPRVDLRVRTGRGWFMGFDTSRFHGGYQLGRRF